ncbi:MAG TPA: DUF167 domain-containing protein [Candidatus Bathyarchaeia archaeon]|nr:DUF167 domain-containing protein [Candidatus Bathyarchaeia archaeon]
MSQAWIFKNSTAASNFPFRSNRNSRKTELIIESDGTLVMHVAASPTDGKANREIVRWLAKRFRRPTSEVRLIGGLHSRTKTIAVLNIKSDELKESLTSEES